MKKYLLLCLALCISVLANAQATDLVIDCQTPGWLSSKINYGDQQTVRNLKVTGYINATDLKFIGTLINSRNLDGELDLSEVNIVSSTSGGKDNLLVDLGLSKYDSIRVYRIPKNVEIINNSTKQLYVDTLYFDCKLKYIHSGMFWNKGMIIGHLHIGENVDSIPKEAFCRIPGTESKIKIRSVHFPSSIKYISDDAFSGSELSECNFNDLINLEYLGSTIYNGDSWHTFGSCAPDTIIVPQKLTSYPLKAFIYNTGCHIFINENTKTLIGGISTKYPYSMYGGGLTFHINQITPPEIIYWRNYSEWFKDATVYVPKGAKSAYENSGWSSTNIIEMNPIVKIEFTNHDVVINKGERKTLSIAITPLDADDKRINWTSENENIVSIDDCGIITAINSGQAYVYATSTATGVKDSCLVTVRKNVESVEFEEKEIVISDIGYTKQLIVTIVPDDATEKSVTWNSSNEQVCTVSANGLVTAVGAGSSVITVTTVDGGHTATCLVKVLQHVSSLALSKHSLSLKVGEQEQLRAIIMPDNADDKNTIWSSSDNHVATIDDNGNITALKSGEAWIKAVSLDNSEAKDSCKVKVVQPVTGISLSQENYQLTNIGENVQLEATVSPADATNKEVKWTSSNEAVCAVSNGKVIATGFGTAVVLAITVDGGFMASCTVIVEKESVTVTSVTISQTSATLSKGETLQLYATALPDDATNKTLVWKSSDEEICVVTQSGLLIAMNEGKAVITVVPQYGAGQAQCSVTVWNEVTTIEDIQIDHQSNAPIYDVTGRKVSRVVKNHLYIQNGKKFIAK